MSFPALLEEARRLLHGYSFIELPDLSAIRHPDDHIHTTKCILDHPRADRVPHVLLAISRILGIYCGASDVLLAVCTGKDELFTFVRVAWTDSGAWTDALVAIGQQMQSNTPIPLSAIRSVLDINDKQSPCMAVCCFSSLSSPSSNLSSQYPLTFIYDSLENLSLICSTKHLHVSISSQLLTQVALTIAHIATNPMTSISHIDLPSEHMSQCERTRTEEDLAAAYPHLIPMPFATDYLTRRSFTHPNSIALQWFSDLSPEMSLDESESLTYLSLHRRANQTARWIRKLGLETEDRVAVCMTRDVLFHIAMIGIMRAGGCYVPIDPDLPSERKAYIARDSNARFVLTTTDVSPKSLFGSCTVFFDEISVQTATREELYDDVDYATPDGLAFLLYTSGTTGNPKGCLLTHKGLSQAIVALSSTAADVHMDDLSQGRYLAVASVAFDVHLGETFVPLVLGMPLVSAPRSQLLENLPFYVKRLGITHLGIVPSLIEATLGAVSAETEGKDMALRYIASGGEKMSDAILDKWADHPKIRLANFYGPSEATIGCCARYMDPETPRANIGRSFANVAGYVVDANLNVLPRGGIGELVVEGPLVGRGYIGRPDLTKKVFLEWPQKTDWAYRTGDLVRMMPDGTFEILGRIDNQIKLRGVRIESEGISSIIRQAVPSSTGFSLDASTILGKHPSIGAEQLISFITWDPSVTVLIRKSQKPSVIPPPSGLMDSIKNICQVELASYMRPSHIIPLSWLPLSSNGKTDVKALAQIFLTLEIDTLTELMANTSSSEKKKRPATQLEKAVFTILARHATIPLSIALPDLNLFACGLDSMSTIRFAKDLYNEFGRRVSASDIMSMPTLAGVASLMEEQHLPPVVDSYTAKFSSKWSNTIQSTYEMASVEFILPPYGVQEGVLSRSADNATLYVQHVIMSCRDHTSIPDLRRAWQMVMTRHSILRTVFFFSSELVQVVLNPDSLSLPWKEEHSDISKNEDFVEWFLSTRAPGIARDINTTLSETPGFRLSAFVAYNQRYIVLSIHHALYDGLSLPLLFQDVEREYHATTLLPLANPYDILDRIASIDLHKAREFWLDHFRGFVWPQVSVPSQTPPSPTVHSIARFRSTLSFLKERSASQNVTLQTVLTSAFGALAATRIYRTNDIAFGIIRSGRLLPLANVENAICPMVSVVPTRINFNKQGNILRNVQSRASAMIEVEHIPLGKVQNWVRPGRALFDLLFSVSIKANDKSDIWDVLESQSPEADYALSVEVVLDPCQDTVIVQAAYRDGYLDGTLVQTFVNDFETITLDACAGKIMSHLSDISISVTRISEFVEHNDEDHLEFIADPQLLRELRQILSNFLDISEALLTETVSFVSLGLDSIKSVGLARTLKRHGHSIRAEDIMKYASLRMLAGRLTSSDSRVDLNNRNSFSTALARVQSSFVEDDLKLSSVDKVTLFPTTTLQAGMLSQTINSHGSLYIHAFPLQIGSEVQFDKLEKAWMQVIESLDILRTSFHFNPDSGIWAQAVHSTNITVLTKENFETNEDYEHKLSAFVGSIRLTKESDLHIPPIWLRLFTPCSEIPNGGTPRLILVMHHSLYDGLSVSILLDMLQSLYLASEGKTSIQQTQFHNLLQHILHQEEHGTSFWKRVLNGIRLSRLSPRSGPQYHNTNTTHTATRTFSCDPVLLADTLRQSAVTVQTLGQVAWGKLIAELTGSPDVVFGHTISGRTIPDAERVIGPVLNTIPCRVHLFGGVRNIDLLRSIHKVNVEALPWQHASLRSIQRDLGFTSLWDSLFVFQPHSSKSLFTLWSFDEHANGEAHIQYPLAIELHQRENGFMLKAACRSEYVTKVELEGLLSRFQCFLENLMLHLNSLALDDVSIQALHVEPAPVLTETQEKIIPPLIKSLLTDITSVPSANFTPITPLGTLGIDSITAIQIVSRFRRAGLVLSTNDIITSRTIGDMVSKVRSGLDDIPKPHSSSLSLQLPPDERAAIIARIASSPEAIEDILPTSSGMKWLIGSWQNSGRTAFHHAFAFQLPADIDILKLQVAWKTLLIGFPILRSTFACASDSPGKPRIVIFKPDSFCDSWIKERALDSEGHSQSILEMTMKELISLPPSMSLPPTRAILCRSSEVNYLILYLHHFQYDAWSLTLIINDLSRLYLGLEPRASNDIRSFLQNSGPSPDNLSEQKRYWQKAFGENFVPTLFPSLLGKLPESYMRTLYTSKEAISKASFYAERARSLEVPLSSVLLACWAEVQGSYTSSGSITIGLWQAGRSGLLDNITSLAFPCLNILPMQIPVPKRGEVIEIAKGISNDLQDRSPIIVQSDLVNISQWVGTGPRSLCNVVVNIGVAPSEATTEVDFIKPVEIPYYVPPAVSEESNPTLDRLATADLIQNDLIVDFAVLPEDDTIMMSIDAGIHMLDDALARDLVAQWANGVREALTIQ